MVHRKERGLALGVALALSLAAAGASQAASASKTYLFLFDNAAHKQALAGQVGAKLKRDYKLVPAFAAELSADEAKALQGRASGLVSVEEDQLYYAMGGGTQQTPYGINLVGAPAAWATTKGAGAKVAVLDTGIDLDHPDHGIVILTTSFIAGEDVTDGNGHGTHTSGTVAALDNEEGVVGVAPEADLMIAKVLSNAGSGPTSGIAAGIDWAVANGANVISMSLGGPLPSAVLKASVDAAVAAGVTVIAASGNAGDDSKSYPAAYPNAISVAAVDATLAHASFSQYGPTIDISGPGVDVLSTVPLGTGRIAGASVGTSNYLANPIDGTAVGAVPGLVYYCGIGDGTAGNTCPAGVAGNIAHIRRGTTSFADKVAYATSLGAAGVIISNNVSGNFNATIGGTTPLVVVSLSQEDGDAVQAQGDGASGAVAVNASDYAYFSGTSMATPHVAGVAALLYSCGGTKATPSAVRSALTSTAQDLGDAGRDDLFGYGLVQAPAAVDDLCNGSGGCRGTIGRGGRGLGTMDVGLLLAPAALLALGWRKRRNG